MRAYGSPNRARPRRRTFTLFEHETLTYAELEVEPHGRCLRELERLNESAETELVKLERTKLRATQFVGALRTSELALHILPKIDSEGSA